MALDNNKKFKNMYEENKLLLDNSKLSAQNELFNANKTASSYLNDYLKSTGIQNSGLGQSAYVDLGNQYQTNMAQLNENYKNELATLKNNYETQTKEEANNILAQGGDPTSYLESLGMDKDSSLYQYYNSLNNATVNNNRDEYIDTSISSLQSLLEDGTVSAKDKVMYNNLIKELSDKNTSDDRIKEIYDEATSSLRKSSTGTTQLPDSLAEEYYSDPSKFDLTKVYNTPAEVTADYKWKDSGVKGSVQNVVNYWDEIVANGLIKNGDVIDLANSKKSKYNNHYMYIDGKLIKTTKDVTRSLPLLNIELTKLLKEQEKELKK